MGIEGALSSSNNQSYTGSFAKIVITQSGSKVERIAFGKYQTPHVDSTGNIALTSSISTDFSASVNVEIPGPIQSFKMKHGHALAYFDNKSSITQNQS